jgi:hypothetical protein
LAFIDTEKAYGSTVTENLERITQRRYFQRTWGRIKKIYDNCENTVDIHRSESVNALRGVRQGSVSQCHSAL